MTMVERVHEHILDELGQNGRTDTIFILTAILLNLISLAVNSAVAGGGRNESTPTIIMFMFVSLIIVVNFVVILGLTKGKETRQKLVEGLMKMYKDQGVEGYYDPTLLGNYNTRYSLFILAVVFTGIVAIVVPFVIRFTAP
jgi:hypothetical protein